MAGATDLPHANSNAQRLQAPAASPGFRLSGAGAAARQAAPGALAVQVDEVPSGPYGDDAEEQHEGNYQNSHVSLQCDLTCLSNRTFRARVGMRARRHTLAHERAAATDQRRRGPNRVTGSCWNPGTAARVASEGVTGRATRVSGGSDRKSHLASGR